MVRLLRKRKVMIQGCIKTIIDAMEIWPFRKTFMEESLHRLRINLALTTLLEDKAGSSPGLLLLYNKEQAEFYLDCELLRLSLGRLKKVTTGTKIRGPEFRFAEVFELQKELVQNRRRFKFALDKFLQIEKRFNLETKVVLESEINNLEKFNQEPPRKNTSRFLGVLLFILCLGLFLSLLYATSGIIL